MNLLLTFPCHPDPRSATGSGVYTMGITLLSFNPLQRLSDRAEVIHQAMREKIAQNADKYLPGQLELLNLQLERLKRLSPGCEMICFPGFRSAPSMLEARMKN